MNISPAHGTKRSALELASMPLLLPATPSVLVPSTPDEEKRQVNDVISSAAPLVPATPVDESAAAQLVPATPDVPDTKFGPLLGHDPRCGDDIPAGNVIALGGTKEEVALHDVDPEGVIEKL